MGIYKIQTRTQEHMHKGTALTKGSRAPMIL
jgi:hypothetical protein